MIRLATDADIPALLALGRQMHAEGVFNHFELDEDKVEIVFRHCIEKAFFAVSESAEGIDGMFAGHIAELWWTRRRCASDAVFFVRPNRRGGIAAVRLIQRFVAWAREQGADVVNISQSSGVRLEEMHRLMTGMSFSYDGGVYQWRIG